MLHMYKNMHCIYINIYTMCKTYGITNKRHGMGGGDGEGDAATMKNGKKNQLIYIYCNDSSRSASPREESYNVPMMVNDTG